MREIIVNERAGIECIEHPDPEPKDNYVLLRITASPLCTEWKGAYVQKQPSRALGHEAAGIVEALGPKARNLSVGDRVVVMPQDSCGRCSLCLAGNHIHCQNKRDPYMVNGIDYGRATIASHCLQQDWMLLPIPDDISDDHASMACCGLGPTFHAMQSMNVRSYHTIAIAGLGPVGLGGVINASHLGARVIGLDPSPYRAQLAKQLGAQEVVDPTKDGALEAILEFSGGTGVDAAVETSNQPTSPPLLLKAVRPMGQISFVSWAGEVQVPVIVGKGLTLHGTWHWNHLSHGEEMFQVIRSNGDKLDQQITHTFPLADIEAAWKLQARAQCGKIILHP